ncbi:(2Fe-2S)-binding protein [Kitasatospora sp. NPDC059571]|uniref:(2Fe-2S)-binding protein n=1 Tax=Kitasatospora sp. NPDC059571 TaxID=3346871 RepID=UPI00369580FD
MLQLTAEPRRPSGDAAADTAAVLRRLLGACPDLRITPVAQRPAGGGWCSGPELALRAEELVAAEADRIEALHGTRPARHVAASLLLHHYLWSVCLLVAGPWYLDGLVVRPDPAALWIDTATGDLALGPVRAAPLGGPDEVREAVAAHCGPVLAAFRPLVRRGPHALWGLVGDDLASALSYLGRALGDEDRAVAAAEAVLPGGTAPFPGAAGFRRLAADDGSLHWTRTRHGCCLYYAVRPAEACLTCPRTCDAERRRRLAP